jgi:hypothetical protein
MEEEVNWMTQLPSQLLFKTQTTGQLEIIDDHH